VVAFKYSLKFFMFILGDGEIIDTILHVINTHRPTSIYLNIVLPAITSIGTYNVGAFPLDQGRVLFKDFVM
jgi:hypothetical protein